MNYITNEKWLYQIDIASADMHFAVVIFGILSYMKMWYKVNPGYDCLVKLWLCGDIPFENST